MKRFRFYLSLVMMLVMVMGGSMSAWAQTKTVKYTLSGGAATNINVSGDVPAGTSVGAVSKFVYDNGNYIVEEDPLLGNNTASIALDGFKYKVVGARWQRASDHRSDISQGSSWVLDFDKNKQGELDYEAKTTDFNAAFSFLKSGVEVDGLSSINIRTTTRLGGILYLLDSQNTKVGWVEVDYVLPTLSFEYSDIKLKTKSHKTLVPDISNAGKFTVADLTFSSSDTNVATVNSKGDVNTVNEGTAIITAKLVYGNVELAVASYTLVVSDKSDVECALGDFYYDYTEPDWGFMTIGRDLKNRNSASWTGKNNDGLRTTGGNAPYEWGEFSSEESGFSVSLKTTAETNQWRVGVGMFSLKHTVPAYSDVSVNYVVKISSVRSSGTQFYHGVDFIDVGTNPWNPNAKDVFTAYYKGDAKGSYTAGGVNSLISIGGKVNATNSNSTNVPFSYSNKSESSPLIETHYYALDSWVQCLNDRDAKANITATVTGTRGNFSYTYYSTVSFDGNGGTGSMESQDIKGTTANKSKVLTTGTALSKNTFTRTGYTFVGWATKPDGSGEKYADGAAFNPYNSISECGKGPVTLYAQWTSNTYDVVLSATDAENEQAKSQTVSVNYDGYMPSVNKEGGELKIPTRKGYAFDGFYENANGSGVKYYDNTMVSTSATWTKASGGGLVANFTENEYKVNVTLHCDGYEVVLTNNPLESRGTGNITIPAYSTFRKEIQQHTDTKKYVFLGWSKVENGAVDYTSTGQPKNSPITLCPADLWDVSGTYDLDLYAVYQAPGSVNLDAQGGIGGTPSVVIQEGYAMPEAIAPTRDGYSFKGYFAQINGGGTKYYDEDMNSAHVWDHPVKNGGGNTPSIYAYWEKNTYQICFDADGGVFNGLSFNTGGNYSYSADNTVLTADIQVDVDWFKMFWSGGTKETYIIKPGYAFLGWYDSDGVKAYDGFDAIPNSKYWTSDLKWKFTSNVTFTARWAKVYDISNNTLTFYSGDQLADKYPGCDHLKGLYGNLGEQVITGAVADPACNGVDIIDARGHYLLKEFMDVVEQAKESGVLSKNVLTYGNGSASHVVNHLYWNDGIYQCSSDFVVTDRVPMRIPFGPIQAVNVTYERNATSSVDPSQTIGGTWGTLCLPFPIDVEQNCPGFVFYELKSVEDSYMKFEKMESGKIAANTPLVYKSAGGQGVTITGKPWTDIPASEASDISSPTAADGWTIVGTRQQREFVGTSRAISNSSTTGKPLSMPDGAYTASANLYYFDKDQFKKISAKGWVTIPAYRAYFLNESVTPDNASLATMSYLCMEDEDGYATDITELFTTGSMKGDGKIYDLNGNRVKVPVKGHIYVVDGKKKMY